MKEDYRTSKKIFYWYEKEEVYVENMSSRIGRDKGL